MKQFIKWFIIFITVAYFGIAAYGQALRVIKTDTLSSNIAGGTIDIAAPITINSSTAVINDILDEDTMVSDSDTALVTQQSVKAYADSVISSIDNIGDVTITGAGVGEVLTWDGAAWVNGVSGSGIGAWVTATGYIIGNVVHEGNHIYLAQTNHTSGVFATDLANGDWVEIDDSNDVKSIVSSTDNAITRWDGITGKLIQDSTVIVGDTGAITGVESLAIGGAVDASSVLDITSTTQGTRPCPTMTQAERDLIGTPATGLCIFNSDTTNLNVYDGAVWNAVGAGGGGLDVWVTATVYVIDDVVHESNHIYLALTDHTSGVFATDLANNEWVELVTSSMNAADVVTVTGYSVKDYFDLSLNQGHSPSLSVTDDGGLNFSWGAGEIYDVTTFLPVPINAGSSSCTDNAITYLYWVSGAILTVSTTPPTSSQVNIATISCQAGDVITIHEEEPNNTRESAIQHGLHELFPVAVAYGLITSEDVDVTNVWDVSTTAGEYYLGASVEKSSVAIDSRTIPMVRHYHVAGAWATDTNAEVNTTQYDDGTDLTAVVANQYYKSCFWIDGGVIHWVYPGVGNINLAASLSSTCPTTPPGLTQLAQSVAVVIQGNDVAFPSTASGRWIDIRPIVGGSATGASITDHGNLTGLTDDDHINYPWLGGRAAGQEIPGGIGASEDLTLRSTVNATKGNILVDSDLLLVDGLVTLPSLSFVSDEDTGLYLSAVNELALSTAGVNALTVDANQNGLFAQNLRSRNKDNDTYAFHDADIVPTTDWNLASSTNVTLGTTTGGVMSGTHSYTMTTSGTSTGFIRGPPVSLTIKNRDDDITKINAIEFHALYSGSTDGAIRAYVYDVGNAVELATVDIEANLSSQKYVLDYSANTLTTSVELRFAVETAEVGIVQFDDIKFTDDPFTSKNLQVKQNYLLTQVTSALTDGSGETEFNLATATITDEGEAIFYAEDDAANTRTKFIALRRGSFDISFSSQGATGNAHRILKNGIIVIEGSAVYTGNQESTVSGTVSLNAGEFFTVGHSGLIPTSAQLAYVLVEATADAEHVITPIKDVANSFSAKVANNGTATITSQGRVNVLGENAIASVNRSASGVVDYVFTTNFFSVIPKVNADVSHTSATGATISIYNISTTGFSTFTYDFNGATADRNIEISIERQGLDVKEAMLLAAIPVQQTMYLKDVKSSGTAGGTFTSGAWQTRVLNTKSGDNLGSLSGNQFTLSSGTYKIKILAPAFVVGNHKVKLVGDPAGTPFDALIGSSAYNTTGSAVLTNSIIEDTIVLTSATTYEVQHRCNTTRATDGLGIASSFGVNEIYTQVEIAKIK